MAVGLRDVVELVLVEVEAADQGLDGAGARVHGNEGAFHFGQLADFPAALALDDADDGTGADLLRGRGLGRQRKAGKAQAVAGDGDVLVVAAAHHDLARRGFGDDGGDHFAGIRIVGQGIGDGFFQQLLVLGQRHEVLGATVGASAIIGEDAAAHGLVGGILVAGGDGGVDVQAARIGFGAVLVVDELAHHLAHIVGVHGIAEAGALVHQLFIAGFLGLFGRDEAVLDHAFQDVDLARAGAAGVDDGVVERGGLGQAGQHGGLGNAHVLDRLAEIGFGSRSKAVGTIAQEDLVEVDLEDLVLGQRVLELECQQHLVDFAREGLFGGEIDVARHLHGNGGGALALGLAEVGQAGTGHADVVDAAVLVEAGVLDGEHGVLHDLGNFIEGHVAAALLAEFGNQVAFGAVDAQRQLGLVVLQAGDVGQVGVGHGEGDQHQQRQGGGSRHGQADQPQKQANQPVTLLGWGRGRRLCRVGRPGENGIDR